MAAFGYEAVLTFPRRREFYDFEDYLPREIVALGGADRLRASKFAKLDQILLDFSTVEPDSNGVPDRELATRVRELSERLKRTTNSAEALACTVAEAIRQERRAGQPHIPPKTDSQTDE